MLPKQKCGEDDICSIRTSPDSHSFWKNFFHENPLDFRIYADFEAYKEFHFSSIGKKQLKFINKTQYLMVMK